MKVHIGNYNKKNDSRKIQVTIDPYDTWNLDSTLAYIIYPALLQMKATKHGMPSEFAEVGGEDWQQQSSFDFYADTCGDCWKLAEERWDEAMDKMIWAFQQMCIDGGYEDKYHTKVPVADDPLRCEYRFDGVGAMLHEERIQEGLDLFSKYYRHLWD